MTPRIQKKLRQARWHEPMHVTHRHAAGVDVHPMSIGWQYRPGMHRPQPPTIRLIFPRMCALLAPARQIILPWRTG